MGDDAGRPDEAPVHEVRVAAFALGATAVTNEEYARFLAAGLAAPPPWWGKAGFDHPQQPVVGVSWFDAQACAAWFGCRLPTEAEWEFATRDDGRWAPPDVPAAALDGPWLVGLGSANGLGLFDLGTAVHEWCADWYDAGFYDVSPRDHPRGPADGTRRASRGGSWRHHVRYSRPAARSSLPPESRYADYGFRLASDVS